MFSSLQTTKSALTTWLLGLTDTNVLQPMHVLAQGCRCLKRAYWETLHKFGVTCGTRQLSQEQETNPKTALPYPFCKRLVWEDQIQVSWKTLISVLSKCSCQVSRNPKFLVSDEQNAGELLFRLVDLTLVCRAIRAQWIQSGRKQDSRKTWALH